GCLALTAGCHGPSLFHPDGCGPACPGPCPPPQTCPQPQRAPQEQAPERGTPTTQTVERSPAAGSPGGMLGPPTVFGPVLAQAPLAPVRLGALTPGAATFTTERRESMELAAPQGQRAPEREAERKPEGPSAAELAALLYRLNCRLDQIESRMAPP